MLWKAKLSKTTSKKINCNKFHDEINNNRKTSRPPNILFYDGMFDNYLWFVANRREFGIKQGSATLLASRATLETT
jgi:hypothetical protein